MQPRLPGTSRRRSSMVSCKMSIPHENARSHADCICPLVTACLLCSFVLHEQVSSRFTALASPRRRHTASSQQMRAIYHALLCKKGTSGESKAPPSPHTMGIMQLHRHFANETGPVDFDAVAAVFGNAPPADTSEAVTRRAAQVLSRPMELMIGRATSGHWNAIIRSGENGQKYIVCFIVFLLYSVFPPITN